MMLSLIPLLWIDCPPMFNEHGVAVEGVLKYTFTKKGISLTLKVVNIGGLWGGEMSLHAKNWGFACPIIKKDVVHNSIEDCFKLPWKRTLKTVENQVDGSKEAVNSFFNEWNSFSTEDKISLFKEEYEQM